MVQALVEHVRLHGLAGAIAAGVASGDVTGRLLADAGTLLEAHVRMEERVLFPLIEESVPDERLGALRLPGADAARDGAATIADLGAPDGRGVAWSARSATSSGWCWPATARWSSTAVPTQAGRAGAP
jgi:hypothetical protein